MYIFIKAYKCAYVYVCVCVYVFYLNANTSFKSLLGNWKILIVHIIIFLCLPH